MESHGGIKKSKNYGNQKVKKSQKEKLWKVGELQNRENRKKSVIWRQTEGDQRSRR